MNSEATGKSRTLLWSTALVVLGLSGAALAQDFTPTFKPVLQIARTQGKIDIDGQLDDAGWKSAARIDKFHETYPNENTKPEVATEVLVTYDDTRFYVAFLCHDDPETVRASLTQRDQWYGDDHVEIYLDTYGAGAWAYDLEVNPHGIQKDFMWTPQSHDGSGFDVIWESAARRTDFGYTVEVAVPFASLRFPDKDVQDWRVEFSRIRPREIQKSYTWSARNQNDQCFPCQFGTINGISGVRAGKGVEILPAMVAHQTGTITSFSNPSAPFDNENPRGELSVGAKYSVSSDVTIEAAVNPDFSQIEADAAQIEVNSTVSLFYPERRPFFQEGSDIFETMFNSFYTRTINDPSFTAKLTSRHGKMRLGMTSAYDENSPYIIPLDASNYMLNGGKSLANIIRGSRQFGENSNIGFLLSDRRYDGGGSGSIGSVDGSFGLTKTWSFRGQYIMSHTTEPTLGPTFGGLKFDRDKSTVALDGESYWGHALITVLQKRSRLLYFSAGYNQIAPTYRTQVGFDPVANHRTVDISGGLTFRMTKGPIARISPQVYYTRRWNYVTGVCAYDQANTSIWVNSRIADTYMGLMHVEKYERWRDRPFAGLTTNSLDIGSQFSRRIGAGGSWSWGTGLARSAAAKANKLAYGLYLELKPVDRLTTGVNLDYSRMTRPSDGARYFNGYIARTRTEFQATKALSVRLVVQYDDFSRNWDFDPLITYRLSPFSMFYLGSTMDFTEISSEDSDPELTKWRTTHRQVFMKLQYLFQI